VAGASLRDTAVEGGAAGTAGTMSRRRFNRALASLGLGLATIPMIVRPGQAAGKVVSFTWADYQEPQLHKAFIAAYGEDAADYTFFADEEEALQKMRAGYTPDVAHPCSYSVGRWYDAGILSPIDVDRLKNWPDIYDSLKGVKGTVTDAGEPLFVPFDWGSSSVLYRTDLVDLEEESWSLLFDERYKGRLSMYDSVDAAVPVAAIVLGYDNPFALDDAQLEKVGKLLATQRDLLRFYWGELAPMEQALASGEIVAAYSWNSSAVNLKKQGVPVKFMDPKEGRLTFVCGLVRIKGGGADEQAVYDFIDAMLEPSAGVYLINRHGYGHSNRRTFEQMDPARLDELGLSDPETVLSQGVFQQEIEPTTREKYIALFEKVKVLGG
jgi:spermidine/putrescine transport system substrate-binding protein